MSRTYRGRHLPTIRGKRGAAQKYVDQWIGKRTREWDEEIWRYLAHTFNSYECIKDKQTNRYLKSCRSCMTDVSFKEAYNLFDQVERDMVAPVAGIGSHPWVSYGAGVRAKKWYKTKGHRQWRRHQKTITQHLLRWHHFGDSNASWKTYHSIFWFIDRWSWT